MLTDGKEREYLSWFYQNEAYNPAAITEDAINEYVSKYSAPGGMRAGLSLIGLFQRMLFKIKIIQRLILQCQYLQ
jgi:hypothetical protein